MASRKHRQIEQAPVLTDVVASSSRQLTRLDLLIMAVLITLTMGIYGQVASHQFIHFDDDVYITSNQVVLSGLSLRGIAWAFTTFESANWHPFTWMSHMLDCQIFGSNAGAHLLFNAFLHSVNGALLFLFLKRVTGARWRSAMVAALFLVHPLHVESVAWASERKDTLSTCLGLLSLLAYANYADKPSTKRYVLVAVWLLLGLMAKPMLVSWPFVFLLLDYWPLRRIQWQPAGGIRQFGKLWIPLVREKIPLFSLVAASMVVTYVAQAQGGAMTDLVTRPLSWRLANALVSYAKYLLLTFWPANLAILYPASRETASFWQWGGALVLLCLATAGALKNVRVRPYLIVGWLFFLGTLIPVIGLVRIGSQAMADRYMYIPSIGLILAVVFGCADLAGRWSLGRAVPILIGSLTVSSLALASVRQIARWRDSETLFQYVLSVTADNPVIQYNLGYVLQQQGRDIEASKHFAEAVRIKPAYVHALANLGLTLRKQGKLAEATDAYRRALELEPNSVKIHWQLGEVLEDGGQNDEALSHFYETIKLNPRDAQLRTDLGVKLARRSKLPEAAEQFREAIRIDPNNAEAHDDLGLVFLSTGQPDKALQEFTTALRLKPDLPGIEDNLRRAREQVFQRGE